MKLSLSFEQRRKSRLRAKAESGEEVALVLERGRTLRGGDRVTTTDGREVEIIGDVAASVYAASSSDDVDVIVRLSQVTRSGQAYLLADGIRRGRFAASLESAAPLTPDEPVRFDVELGKQAAEAKEGLQKLLEDPATAADRKERIEGDPPIRRLPHGLPRHLHSTADRDVRARSADRRPRGAGPAAAPRPRQHARRRARLAPAAEDPDHRRHRRGAESVRIRELPRGLDRDDRQGEGDGVVTLIPGHGLPQKDTAYLDKLIAAITDVRAQVGPLAKAGMPIEEIRKKVDFSKAIAMFGDTPRIKQGAQGYFFDPMILNAYLEARGEPIVQGQGSPEPDVPRDTPPKPSSIHHAN